MITWEDHETERRQRRISNSQPLRVDWLVSGMVASLFVSLVLWRVIWLVGEKVVQFWTGAK